jgi:hypothetical protein
MGRRYLGTEALIGQEVPWYRGSNWTGGFFYLLKKRRTKKIGQARRYLGAEALIGREVS